jgi:hypothetical protein
MSRVKPWLIAGVVCLGISLAIHLARSEPPTRIGCPIAGERASALSQTWVNLTFKDFHPAGNQFTGSVSIEVAPQLDRIKPDAVQNWAKSFKQVLLRFYHFNSQALTYQGGADEPIALAFPPAWGSLMGKGTFGWTGDSRFGPFVYPFDTYVLRVNPDLIQLTDASEYSNAPIDTLQMDFENSNFIPHLIKLNAQQPNDPYQVELQRPAILRVLAVIIAILLVAWLIYLIWFANPDEYAGNVVTLFVGVFSIRTSLLSGAPVFPSLIDYCALAVYLSAALVVLVKWSFPDNPGTQECPLCRSKIPQAATVCPQCTHPLPAGP